MNLTTGPTTTLPAPAVVLFERGDEPSCAAGWRRPSSRSRSTCARHLFRNCNSSRYSADSDLTIPRPSPPSSCGGASSARISKRDVPRSLSCLTDSNTSDTRAVVPESILSCVPTISRLPMPRARSIMIWRRLMKSLVFCATVFFAVEKNTGRHMMKYPAIDAPYFSTHVSTNPTAADLVAMRRMCLRRLLILV